MFSFQSFQQKVSKPTKTSKKIAYFTVQFRSKNFPHFTNLNSLNIVKSILLRHCQKPYFTNFPAKMFLVGLKTKFAQQHYPEMSKNYILKELGKQISVYSCISPQGNFSPRDERNIYLVGLNNFLKAARCLGYAKCFKIFHFN